MSALARFTQESRALLRLAGPIILSQVAQVLMGLVDTVMSGHAGAREQAVVGLGVAADHSGASPRDLITIAEIDFFSRGGC